MTCKPCNEKLVKAPRKRPMLGPKARRRSQRRTAIPTRPILDPRTPTDHDSSSSLATRIARASALPSALAASDGILFPHEANTPIPVRWIPVWRVFDHAALATFGPTTSLMYSAIADCAGVNRVTFVWRVPVAFGGTAFRAKFEAEGSIDMDDWVSLGISDETTAQATSGRLTVADVSTSYVRVKATFEITSGAGLGASVTHLVARFDRK